MATITAPELAWGLFWTAVRADHGSNNYHNGSIEQKLSRPKQAAPLVAHLPCLNSAMRSKGMPTFKALRSLCAVSA
eukprot:4930814-Alexandrium_andersonii.AAC.1